MSDDPTESNKHFIQQIIEDDLTSGKHSQIITRFPPEPNGYLHIGHAKAICVDFGLAAASGGTCHLRFDDTNPVKEDVEYVESIKADIRWLGFDWNEHLYQTSDYFDQLFTWAVELIDKGLAYVCSLDAEAFKAYRGVPTEAGKESPSRNRPAEENLDLFARMKAGEFPDGTYVLRAKIDMASPNLHMRDPVLYRIKHATHHATGDTWCIYPMYDYSHPLSDAIEHITHSLCTLEFEVHRPLYDWCIEHLSVPSAPRQIEFARLNLTYTVMSKRLLLQMVQEGLVNGWDDPRMPTLSGMRRRGYPPAAIRNLCETVGVTKFNSLTDMSLLEFHVREDLNKSSLRFMGVLDPLKVVITNYPEDEEETFSAVNNPGDEAAGTRDVPFAREIYIERGDFMEIPPPKFFRLSPGKEVRLRAACYITCDEVIKDASGEIIELHCSWDPASRGGGTPDNRKVKSTLHWVSATHALDAEVRNYDRLFTVEQPMADKEKDFKDFLNPESLTTVMAKVEPALASVAVGETIQFERLGYFCVDPDSSSDRMVFNRTVTLRDTWAKVKGK
ncbi:MAG: glutaminyl-tRNA synthetase [Kiritimatiellia bacterium]|jgi:glutaminyl-tRNA synthetase